MFKMNLQHHGESHRIRYLTPLTFDEFQIYYKEVNKGLEEWKKDIVECYKITGGSFREITELVNSKLHSNTFQSERVDELTVHTNGQWNKLSDNEKNSHGIHYIFFE